ncbi:metallophosphoesterase [Chroococcidiopsis sp. FACHB-1243]|uniref:metallophosphoesterase n=1 Tax=Chroococcidiopsis sp. [FACHB-1243] TaxID=2692781 RepID=UPI0017804055|nr:metallophosphoesterase [Chroococcidiopsis sp. [FACHB-1243]]MBD2307754.1 metallophosphoesterase [Chroococcidiopsis sp. [FACHB-1243]]
MKKIKYIFLSLLGLIGALLLWGLLEPYIIDTQEEVVVIPNLPSAWEGQRVAVIGDWQVGMWLDNTLTIRRIVQQLIEERPALILIVGDFIYHANEDPSQEISQVIELVRPLPASGIPTYAVLGNHDYALASDKDSPDRLLATKLERELETVGVQVLQNQAVTLKIPRKSDRSSMTAETSLPLYLVGIGSHWADNDRPVVALTQVPDKAPRFAMMHHPDSFAKFPPNTAPIAVAGHTHGGQIRLPFLPERTWLSYVKDDEVYADGWIDGYGEPGNHLYVNRGIGFSLVPIRINCPPEITFFTLRQSP